MQSRRGDVGLHLVEGEDPGRFEIVDAYQIAEQFGVLVRI